MWPFKTKAKIYNTGLGFNAFGNQTHSFTKLFTANQNNTLLLDYFNNISEVAAPIMKYSDGAARMKFKTNIPEVEKLLNNPNYYQDFNQFLSLLIIYKRLFGNSVINFISSTDILTAKSKPIEAFVMSPQRMKISTENSTNILSNKILEYKFSFSDLRTDKSISVNPENILHLKNANPNVISNQYLFGISKYAGVYRNIESIIEGYGAKVMLYKNGPRLVITGKATGEFASMSSSEDIKKVQDRMSMYGFGEGKYQNLITDVPLDVRSVSLNVGQLQILENNASDFQRICDAQGIDSRVFSDLKGSTFSNKEAALNDFWNGSFKGEIDSTFESIREYLSKFWPNLELIPDYSQIAAIVAESQKEKDRILKEAEKGLITRNEYLERIGQEKRPEKEFNELYFLTSNGWTNGRETSKDI
jgi:phage portal protein BeeE